ncbi:hypothetical protein D3C71_1921000 [compost metagenome]
MAATAMVAAGLRLATRVTALPLVFIAPMAAPALSHSAALAPPPFRLPPAWLTSSIARSSAGPVISLNLLMWGVLVVAGQMPIFAAWACRGC